MSNTTSKATWQRWIPVVVVGAFLAASSPAAGDSRWYLAGKLGQASVEENFGPPVLGWRVDGDDSAASIEVGYALHRYLGIQAGYHDLGAYEGRPRPCPPGEDCPRTLIAPPPALVPAYPVDAEFTGFSLSAVPRWPVTERFSVYGKLGVLDWEGKLSPALDVPQRVERPSDQDLLAGIGAEYAFPNRLGVLVEYETSDLFDTVSLGASWRF